MGSIWLLQPLSAKKVEAHKSGFDKYFRIEYVGYAEYEFGAFPQALKTARENGVSTCHFETGTVNGLVSQTVYLVGDKTTIGDWSKEFANWAMQPQTKGATRFWDALKEEGLKHALVRPAGRGTAVNLEERVWFDLQNRVAIALRESLVPLLEAAFAKT